MTRNNNNKQLSRDNKNEQTNNFDYNDGIGGAYGGYGSLGGSGGGYGTFTR